MKKHKRQKDRFASFSEFYEYRKLRREVGTGGLFLCLICVVGAAVFWIRSLARVGAAETRSLAAAVFFLCVLLAYLLFPVSLFLLLRKLRPVTNTVGKYVLRAILVPVYFLFCLLSLPFVGKHRKKYQFAAWDEDAPPAGSYYAADTRNAFREKASGTFRFLTALLGATAKNGQYFLFPILILLLLLGLFFYFISSSSILGFVYTLF